MSLHAFDKIVIQCVVKHISVVPHRDRALPPRKRRDELILCQMIGQVQMDP